MLEESLLLQYIEFSEVLRIWKATHWIEDVFKRFEHTCDALTSYDETVAGYEA